MGIAQRLTEALTKTRRSQNWLAGKTGVAQSTLNRQMKEGTLALETVISAAQALDVDLHWLLTGEGTRGGAREVEPTQEIGSVTESYLRVIQMDSEAALRRAEALKELAVANRVEAENAASRAIAGQGRGFTVYPGLNVPESERERVERDLQELRAEARLRALQEQKESPKEPGAPELPPGIPPEGPRPQDGGKT